MKQLEPMTISTAQMAALTRVAGAGGVLVSEAMTKMTGQAVSVGRPAVRSVPITRVADLLGGGETRVVALHTQIHGMLRGEILIALSPATAGWLLASILGASPSIGSGPSHYPDRLLAQPMTSPSHGSLTGIAESALLEFGNTTAARYLNAVGDAAGQSLLVSPPEMAIDMAGAVVDDILVETARGAANLPLIELDLEAGQTGCRVRMLHLLDPETLHQLVTALCRRHVGGRRETVGGD